MARWICVALLLLYAVYSGYEVISHRYWISLTGTILAFIAAAGLARRWPWSRFVLYFFTFSSIAEWAFVLWRTHESWMNPAASDTVRLAIFLPALLMTGFCLFACWVAHRMFRRQTS
jgi:hypothetical protein